MLLHLNNKHPHHRISPPYFEKRIRKILHHLGLANKTELGITFVTDRVITRLNQKYRRKNKPTDVLSFPLNVPFILTPAPRGRGIKGEGPFLGDIVISVDTLKKEAIRLHKSIREHALFLIIHGLLHLLGYDHVRLKDWKKMKKKEEELLVIASDMTDNL